MPKRSAPTEWWSEGVQFECQGSGKCCTSRGEYGYVFFSIEDRQRAAKLLKITEVQFREQYCQKVDGAYALKDPADKNPDCIFLKSNRCSIYEGRPTQCRTWPFWPEVMSAKAWNKGVAEYCPGVGKGKVISADVIRATLAEQIGSEISIAKETK
ncbi:MAG: YkgJ family cysteine cluster protein [Bdellovibrionota bacterium]